MRKNLPKHPRNNTVSQMRIQIHSDIHLEKYPHRRLTPKCSTLVLAGDIGVPLFKSYTSFFSDTSKSFDKIYYVLGNHEYERAWMGVNKQNDNEINARFCQRNQMIKDILSAYQNVEIIDNQYTKIGDLLVYGGTLWSNFRVSSHCSETKKYLSDQHDLFQFHMTQKPDLLITHYVSCRSVLRKPWSIGLGPRKDLIASRYIFGHIHYPIETTQVKVNPWGEGNVTESGVWLID